jgi:hypothetical protein
MQGRDDKDIAATDADQGPHLVLPALEVAHLQGSQGAAGGLRYSAAQRKIGGKIKNQHGAISGRARNAAH